MLSRMEAPTSRRTSRKKAELAHVGKVPSFVSHLWSMLHDDRWARIVHFSEDGASFLIEDEEALAQHVLPHYFNTNSVASFVRQLNFYNFKRVTEDIPDEELATTLLERMNGERRKRDAIEYRHRFFHRDHSDWLTKVIRKTNHRAIRQLVEARAGPLDGHRAMTGAADDIEADPDVAGDPSFTALFEASMAEVTGSARGPDDGTDTDTHMHAHSSFGRSSSPPGARATAFTAALHSAGLQLVGATQTTLRLDGSTRRFARMPRPRAPGHTHTDDDMFVTPYAGKRTRPLPKLRSESLLDVLQGDESMPLSPSVLEVTAQYPMPGRGEKRRRSATQRTGERNPRRTRRRLDAATEADAMEQDAMALLAAGGASMGQELTSSDDMVVDAPSRRPGGSSAEIRPEVSTADLGFIPVSSAYSPALEEAALSLCLTRRSHVPRRALDSSSSSLEGDVHMQFQAANHDASMHEGPAFPEVAEFLSPLHAVTMTRVRGPQQEQAGLQFQVSTLQSPVSLTGPTYHASIFSPLGSTASIAAPPMSRTPSGSSSTATPTGAMQMPHAPAPLATLPLPSSMAVPGNIIYILDEHGALLPYEVNAVTESQAKADAPSDVVPPVSAAGTSDGTQDSASTHTRSDAQAQQDADGARSLSVDTSAPPAALQTAPTPIGSFTIPGPAQSFSQSTRHVMQPRFTDLLTPALRGFLSAMSSSASLSASAPASTSTTNRASLLRTAIRNAVATDAAGEVRDAGTSASTLVSPSHVALSPLHVRLTPRIVPRSTRAAAGSAPSSTPPSGAAEAEASDTRAAVRALSILREAPKGAVDARARRQISGSGSAFGRVRSPTSS